MNNRLSKLRSLMVKHHLDAALVSSVPNITYLTNFSHFSKDEREAFLFITFEKQYVLTDGRYSEAVKKHMRNQILSLPKYELVEISPKHTFEKALKDLAKKHKIKKLGFEENDLTVKEHKALLSSRLPRLRQMPDGIWLRSGQAAWRDLLHHSLDSLRVIKNAREISMIEKACAFGDKTFKYILNKIKLGITEKQLAFEIEFFIKKAGADISFPPIVAFGANSAIPHHIPTHNSKLPTHNSIILLDFGVKLNNYCSDMTRTVFFGKPTVEQKRMYQTVLEAQKRAIEHLKFTLTQFPLPSRERGRVRGASSMDSSNKILTSDIDKVSRDYVTSQGFPTIPHSLGHGVGLEVHELPRLSPKSTDILNISMVFTIEPGIYIPNFGGVRIEDVVVLEKSGPRLLTKSPKEIIEL